MEKIVIQYLKKKTRYRRGDTILPLDTENENKVIHVRRQMVLSSPRERKSAIMTTNDK
jgi:hypothetical protein